MHELCFLSGLSSNEWAAWIQALGSIAAIVAAAKIATNQSKKQHTNAINLHYQELRSAKLDVARTLLVLADNSKKIIVHTISQLSTREDIYKVAEGLVPSDFGELKRINKYLNDIPLHTLPNTLVTPTMLLGSTVRQFYEKIDMMFIHYRKMDSDMYDDFFRSMEEMENSIELTCEDIAKGVNLLQ